MYNLSQHYMINEHSIMMYPSNKNESSKSKILCQYDSPCNPKDSDYEKLFCPNNELSEPSKTRSDRLKTGSSCQALKHAVAALYRIDDFHKEKIGEGFFSEVFKVTDRSTGHVMVLKMNTRHSNRRNMLKEIELMNRLSHVNVLRLLGVCVHQGQLHALTEHIGGGSLYQLVHDRAVQIAQATRVAVALDVARGMEYLHARGVIHRDLTSKNILVKPLENGKVRALVADFGLSTEIPDPEEKTKLPIVGSAYWMSPEMLKGLPYDERCDIFSYGIVLCEVIARVEADPDYLPRTDNFGLDYLAFTEMCEPNVVPEFLKLAFRCCNVDPKCRPTFTENVQMLSDILTEVKLRVEKEKRMANCAAKSEEQLTVLAHQYNATQHQKILHRRSLSEDAATLSLSALATPGDKARRHALLMCRQDPHYRPRTTNPFLGLARLRGATKLLGNFSSCLEMAPAAVGTAVAVPPKEPPRSLPGSPTAVRKGCAAAAAHINRSGSGSTLSEGGCGAPLRRRGSCESGFYSSVGECLSPTSLWGGSGTAAGSLPSLDELDRAWRKRASSVYSDSSEDAGGGPSGGGPQPHISAIVEYFERKGGALRRPGSARGGLQLSSRVAALRRSLERHHSAAAAGSPTQLAAPRPAGSRLVICEGAVASKLRIFDRK